MFLLVLPNWPTRLPSLAPVDGVSLPFPTLSGSSYQRGNHSLYASERLGVVTAVSLGWSGSHPDFMAGLFAKR